MTLKQGDSGEAVKELQRGLNRLGSLLMVDGDYGPGTSAAVRDACTVLGRPESPDADDAMQAALAAAPDLFPPLGAPGVTFIARLEVSSAREYRRRFQKPILPSADSGITIGIGYDLKFVDRAQLQADWGPHLSAANLELLAPALGRPGSSSRLAMVQSVEVLLPAAMAVFVGRSLPEYLAQTRSIYPEVGGLSASRRTSLVSLVYNRGPSLRDRDRTREDRREMRNIQALLAAGNHDAVADEFDSMARLWNPQRLAGLVQRRHDEARLWRSGFSALQLD